jgi:hypothetical protein
LDATEQDLKGQAALVDEAVVVEVPEPHRLLCAGAVLHGVRAEQAVEGLVGATIEEGKLLGEEEGIE